MQRRLCRVNVVVVWRGTRPEKEVRVIGYNSPLKHLEKSELRENEVLSW